MSWSLVLLGWLWLYLLQLKCWLVIILSQLLEIWPHQKLKVDKTNLWTNWNHLLTEPKFQSGCIFLSISINQWLFDANHNLTNWDILRWPISTMICKLGILLGGQALTFFGLFWGTPLSWNSWDTFLRHSLSLCNSYRAFLILSKLDANCGLLSKQTNFKDGKLVKPKIPGSAATWTTHRFASAKKNKQGEQNRYGLCMTIMMTLLNCASHSKCPSFPYFPWPFMKVMAWE